MYKFKRESCSVFYNFKYIEKMNFLFVMTGKKGGYQKPVGMVQSGWVVAVVSLVDWNLETANLPPNYLF